MIEIKENVIKIMPFTMWQVKKTIKYTSRALVNVTYLDYAFKYIIWILTYWHTCMHKIVTKFSTVQQTTMKIVTEYKFSKQRWLRHYLQQEAPQAGVSNNN